MAQRLSWVVVVLSLGLLDRGFLVFLTAIYKTVPGGPFACSVAMATCPGSQFVPTFFIGRD